MLRLFDWLMITASTLLKNVKIILKLFFNGNIKMKYDSFFENSRVHLKWLT